MEVPVVVRLILMHTFMYHDNNIIACISSRDGKIGLIVRFNYRFNNKTYFFEYEVI
jgi:hypothetical protein